MLIIDPSPPTFPMAEHALVPTRSIELPAHSPRKRYKVNGVPRRTLDLIGQMKVVLFAPSDLHLVDGGPDERRRFMDRALCQLQPRYSQALVTYRKIVSQRSALLKRIRENQEDPKMLNYLDEQLTQLANQIIYERVRMVDALNEQANQFQQVISGGREHLQIIYRPSFHIDPSWSPLEAPQHYREQLLEIRKREIMQGVCLRGPHRDELEFLVNGVNMLSYGSRGQQRTAALAAKLSELSFMHTSTGDQPILLLDDVFSELDSLRREYLLAQIARYEQVMLTSTDLDNFPADLAKRSYRYRVTDGALTKE
jgi:DNA replication and repair protein RecF